MNVHVAVPGRNQILFWSDNIIYCTLTALSYKHGQKRFQQAKVDPLSEK